MPRISALLSTLALAAVLASPAQATPPTDDEVITVTGTVMNEDEARTRSRAHVGAVLGTPVSGQNARWSAPLCIAIVGVQPSTAGPFLDRIEAVVRSSGADLGKKGCRPNVVVHFTANADADFAAIERKRPDLFEQTFAEDREKLRTPGLPVRWFYGRKLEGVGGRQLDVDPSGGTLAGMPILREGGASRITTPVQVNITSATVLVDVPRVSNVPLKALADYIAFAMLSRTRIDVEPASGSIMALFQAPEDARPEGLTALDLAFLKALYDVPINFVSTVHRGTVMEKMVQQLSAAPAP
jgi:hypothetical protein